jgi:hypothetical protein
MRALDGAPVLFIMNTCIIAIDPGASGGLAVKDGSGKVYTESMPDTEGDIIVRLEGIRAEAYVEDWRPIAIVEDQTGYAGIQVSAPAMFKYGRNFGFILGTLQATGWIVELVKPQMWIKALSLGNRRNHASRTAWKNHLKTRAQQYYPNLKVTLATADALLILAYYLKK